MLRDYDVTQPEALGFTPAYELEDAFRNTFAWLRDHSRSARW
jgi:nucleoside-diphosphate-sugar epimerase